jgi:hypothetical protein
MSSLHWQVSQLEKQGGRARIEAQGLARLGHKTATNHAVYVRADLQ